MIKELDSEQELLRGMQNGSEYAMKNFYAQYSGYLTVVCSRYINNTEDIKDVLQESFIKIFNAIKRFEYKGCGSLKAWSSKIVVNESLKRIKENGKLNITTLPGWELPEVEDNNDPNFDNIPTSAILKMIQSLPSGYRTVFNLYVFEKKSHKEIASILDIAENTSASQFHRAKNLLVKEITLYRSKNKSYE